MRKLLFVILFIVSTSVKAQLPKNSSGKIEYAETIALEGAGADELYRRSKTWMLENFTKLKEIVKKDDASNHLIVINGKGECYAEHAFGDTIDNVNHSYTLTIETRDGGYSYSMTDFYTTDKWKGEIPSETFKGGKKPMEAHEQTLRELAATLTLSLKLAMAAKISVGNE